MRVAIIGGGCAAMSAAHALTQPEQNGRFDVTVYQQGWRLGGKGASGRGPNGRIEEHGLHIWMGFYENAFRLMRAAYGEAGRDPAKCPIADWRQAFFPASRIGLASNAKAPEWGIWSTVFPPLDGEPGDPLENDLANPFTIPGYLARSASMLRTLFELAYRGSTPLPADSNGAFTLGDILTDARALSRVAQGAIESVAGLVENQVLTLARVMGLEGAAAQAPLIADLGRALSTGLDLLRPTAANDPVRQHAGEVLEAIVAVVTGLFRAGVVIDPRGLDALDEMDFIDWLRLNGLSDRAAKSPFLLGLYSLMFAFEGGDPTKPRAAAGQALRGILRMFFTYRGSLFWKMTAGMGDVIFAPLYEVLAKRGVNFEFFHRLKNVQLDASGKHAAGLEFLVQADVVNGKYRPLVDIHGLPSWPADPDWTQLVGGEVAGREFESHWDESHVRTKTLAVGRDFDFVVVAVGGGAVPYVCSELVERNPRWQTMAANIGTVATQALQLWMPTTVDELGFEHGSLTLTAFEYPFDTWSDMTHLLSAEDWPKAAGMRSVAYFCNVLDEREVASCAPRDAHFQDRVQARVRANAQSFITEQLPNLWPNWRANAKSLEGQFYVGNVNPSDRYVQCLPGSIKYRISPLDRTFDNLTIAGDWTSCGMSFGCVESAVISGQLASHALSGLPKLTSIVGYDHP